MRIERNPLSSNTIRRAVSSSLSSALTDWIRVDLFGLGFTGISINISKHQAMWVGFTALVLAHSGASGAGWVCVGVCWIGVGG